MWILLSLLAGAGDALRDTSTKRFAGAAPYILVSWAYSLFALPFFLPLLISHRPETLAPEFWPLLLSISTLHVAGGVLIVNTIKAGELSLSIPLAAFTPVFILFLAPITTGDAVTTVGILGSLLVVLGSYMLNVSRAKDGLLAPIRALARQPGPRGMLMLSVLWSVTSSIDRFAVRNTPLEFWASAQLLAISVIFFPIILRSGEIRKLFEWNILKKLLLVGAFSALSFYPYICALKIAPAHFVVCLKRSGIFFTMLIGKFCFNEHHIRERLLGALIMLIGVVIISLF